MVYIYKGEKNLIRYKMFKRKLKSQRRPPCIPTVSVSWGKDKPIREVERMRVETKGGDRFYQ